MANWAFTSAHAATRKIWSYNTIIEMEKYLFWLRFMGPGPNNIIQVEEQLMKERGDRITFYLAMKLTGAGVSGDTAVEDAEEQPNFYTDTVTIDQLRHGIRLAGRVTEQRIAIKLRPLSVTLLAIWMAEKLDSYTFRFMWGDATLTHGETGVAPEATSIIYGGDATSTATVDASDVFDITMLDAAKEKAKTRSPKFRPVIINGQEFSAAVLHPYQMTDFQTNTAAGQWMDIQKQLILKEGLKAPIFTGAAGVYKGVILFEHDNINTATTWGAGSNVNGAEALFLGAQAGCFAWAEKPHWEEEVFDYRNKTGFSVGAMFGVTKTIFNSLDYAVFVMRTAAASHS